MGTFRVLAVALLAAAAACEPDPVGSRAAEEPSPAAAPAGAPPGRPHTPDHEFARVARAEVPGFAGFYLRPDGTPVVRLRRPDSRAAAERYLAPHLAMARRGRHAGPPRQPIVLPARYDFAQLVEWSEALHPLLGRGDVYLLDVDEVENRLHLGVRDAGAAAAVRRAAASLGIPADAVHPQPQPAPEPRITVRDRQPTLRGGVQVAFGSYVCSLGFYGLQRRTVGPASVLVTNSHCTPVMFATDGGKIYQNTVWSANLIGTEIRDRALYACAGEGTSCRQADAAYILPDGTRPIARGGIARTAWASGERGGLEVIGEFDIVARYAGTLPVGSYLDKTGRTSGSTFGMVTHSCVTIGSLRCQDISQVWSEGGDSGAPVYVWVGGNDVHLHGLMWGGPGSDYTTTYSSRLTGIEADLGLLTHLCRIEYPC